jgi:hypothetical protein
MKAFAIVVLAACASTPMSTTYRANPQGELSDPAVRAIVVGRAARDLACDPGAVVVRAFALPKELDAGDGSSVEYTSVGLAVVEGNGQRITYAVAPTKFDALSGWTLVDDDLVMIAHIPVIASAPPLPPDDSGSASDGSGSATP